GTREQGEEALATAQRELREECGLTGGAWEELGAFWTTPGFCREHMVVFLATEVEAGDADPDDDEALELVRWPVGEIGARLSESGIAAVAYETVETDDHRLPLLAPMSEIAGRLAPQAGAYFLEKPRGGRGLLLGGVPGVQPGRVLVLGGGVVGYNASIMAIGLGAQVTILDKSIDRMRYLDEILSGRVNTVMSSALQIE